MEGRPGEPEHGAWNMSRHTEAVTLGMHTATFFSLSFFFVFVVCFLIRLLSQVSLTAQSGRTKRSVNKRSGGGGGGGVLAVEEMSKSRGAEMSKV